MCTLSLLETALNICLELYNTSTGEDLTTVARIQPLDNDPTYKCLVFQVRVSFRRRGPQNPPMNLAMSSYGG